MHVSNNVEDASERKVELVDKKDTIANKNDKIVNLRNVSFFLLLEAYGIMNRQFDNYRARYLYFLHAVTLIDSTFNRHFFVPWFLFKHRESPDQDDVFTRIERSG